MTPAGLERLRSGAAAILGGPLTDTATQQFCKYFELLTKWQKRHRLVGSTDPEWVVENLFLDSLLFFRVLPPDIQSVVDVGSGGGFPGYPLKIVKPAMEITLIDSRHMRSSFLKAVVRELALSGVTVLHGRVETLGAQLQDRFDAAVLRCAGTPRRILPSAAKLVRPGGIVVASGPPAGRQLSMGAWIVVDGASHGSKRRFAVHRRS